MSLFHSLSETTAENDLNTIGRKYGLDSSFMKIMLEETYDMDLKQLSRETTKDRLDIARGIGNDYLINSWNNQKRIKSSWRNQGPRPLHSDCAGTSTAKKAGAVLAAVALIGGASLSAVDYLDNGHIDGSVFNTKLPEFYLNVEITNTTTEKNAQIEIGAVGEKINDNYDMVLNLINANTYVDIDSVYYNLSKTGQTIKDGKNLTGLSHGGYKFELLAKHKHQKEYRKVNEIGINLPDLPVIFKNVNISSNQLNRSVSVSGEVYDPDDTGLKIFTSLLTDSKPVGYSSYIPAGFGYFGINEQYFNSKNGNFSIFRAGVPGGNYMAHIEVSSGGSAFKEFYTDKVNITNESPRISNFIVENNGTRSPEFNFDVFDDFHIDYLLKVIFKDTTIIAGSNNYSVFGQYVNELYLNGPICLTEYLQYDKDMFETQMEANKSIRVWCKIPDIGKYGDAQVELLAKDNDGVVISSTKTVKILDKDVIIPDIGPDVVVPVNP